MHRSCTSILAKEVKNCEINIGDNLNGHFEDTDFLEIHKQILESRTKNAKHEWLYNKGVALSEDEKIKLQDLLGKKSSKGFSWGVKDPRLIYFLDFYYDIIPHKHFIFIYRTPSEVVESCMKRESRDASFKLKYLFSRSKFYKWRRNFLLNRKYLESWIFYNGSIIRFIKKHDLSPKSYSLFTVPELKKDPAIVGKVLFQKGLISSDQNRNEFNINKPNSDIRKSFIPFWYLPKIKFIKFHFNKLAIESK